jgi:quinol monooxygenase YgiN
MRTIMVRYKTKPDRADENERLIRKVFEELREMSPAGIRYASFKLADGQSFVHIATTDSADGGNPLTQTPAFKTFVAGVKDRCEEPPVTTELSEVGSYRFFD